MLPSPGRETLYTLVVQDREGNVKKVLIIETTSIQFSPRLNATPIVPMELHLRRKAGFLLPFCCGELHLARQRRSHRFWLLGLRRISVLRWNYLLRMWSQCATGGKVSEQLLERRLFCFRSLVGPLWHLALHSRITQASLITIIVNCISKLTITTKRG